MKKLLYALSSIAVTATLVFAFSANFAFAKVTLNPLPDVCTYPKTNAITATYCPDSFRNQSCQTYRDGDGDGHGDRADGLDREDFSYICPGETILPGYSWVDDDRYETDPTVW